MKLLNAFLLLVIPSIASAQMADWHVTIGTVNAQDFQFETGAGGGTTPNYKVLMYKECRTEVAAASRTSVGEVYPTPNIGGMSIVTTGVTSPPTLATNNALTWTFLEGIDQNTLIYTRDSDEQATVTFCLEIGLYDETTLVDFAELKLTYTVDLTTSFIALDGYAVTQVETNTDNTEALSFDAGDLNAFFCDGTTLLELPESTVRINQGSIINVCFEAAASQFEVADVNDLTITGGSHTQVIIASKVFPGTSPYGVIDCQDGGATVANYCKVSFLLKAEFYDNADIVLGGNGVVEMEFGDATATRRKLRRSLQTGEKTTAEKQIQPHMFAVEVRDSSAVSAISALATIGALAGAALAL